MYSMMQHLVYLQLKLSCSSDLEVVEVAVAHIEEVGHHGVDPKNVTLVEE